MKFFIQIPAVIMMLSCTYASNKYESNDSRIGIPQRFVLENPSVRTEQAGDTSKELATDDTLDCDLMLTKVNQFRSDNGKSPLKIDERLVKAAQLHSEDQATQNKMTHTGSDGSTSSQRVEKQGYKWQGVAENVAHNYKSIDRVMNGWINSPGHRKNLLGNYIDFGCGFKNYFWTQDFGKERNW